MKRIAVWICVLLLIMTCLSALAQEERNLNVLPQCSEIGDNYVTYPQLEGLEDETIQTAVNKDIIERAQITDHMMTLVTMGDSVWGLKVNYRVQLLTQDVFSVVISAQGKMPNGREGQMNTALTYDLTTGEALTLDHLFADADTALETLGEIAEDRLLYEMSSYMDQCEVTPLPAESFTIGENGITFWYSANQVYMLSGYCGACNFWFSELGDLLLPAEELPAGVAALLTVPEDEKTFILSAAEAGRLPNVPVTIGDAMGPILDEYRLVRTPDEFPGGRYFVLEAPEFRDIRLMDDTMYDDWEESELRGIQLHRGNLGSLMIGQTMRDAWLELLGSPDETVTMSEDMAYSYDVTAVQYDLYRADQFELYLYSNQEGLLSAVELSK